MDSSGALLLKDSTLTGDVEGSGSSDLPSDSGVGGGWMEAEVGGGEGEGSRQRSTGSSRISRGLESAGDSFSPVRIILPRDNTC